MEIINLLPSDYYSQLNNEYDPFNACKPTSRIMFYIGNGFKPNYPKTKYKQEEDIINYMLHSKAAVKWCKDNGRSEEVIKDPNLDNYIYPQWLDKQLFGKQISEFAPNMSLEQMIVKLANKEILQTSGLFDYFSTKQNQIIKISHSINLIGFYDEGFIIADPYNRDYHTNYKLGKGYGVKMSFTDARKILKGLDDTHKWCHYKI